MSDFTYRFREAHGSGTLVVEAPCSRDTISTFAQSVAAGLSDDPKWLHCRFLYDAEGSRLFEAITEQPEYYPTRTEASILAQHAADIRAMTGPVTLVELGSGLDVDRIEHVAEWNADRQRMEISARFHSRQCVRVAPTDQVFEIGAGETVLMEVSRKFRLPSLAADLARFGFRVRKAFTDDDQWFGLLLLQRSEEPVQAP